MTKLITINGTLRAFVAELEDGGVDEPLIARLTLAAVWADLARLAGEALPADVSAALGDDDPPPDAMGGLSGVTRQRPPQAA